MLRLRPISLPGEYPGCCCHLRLQPGVPWTCKMAKNGLVCESRHSSVQSDMSPASIWAWTWFKTTHSAEAIFFRSGGVAASSNQLPISIRIICSTNLLSLVLIESRHWHFWSHHGSLKQISSCAIAWIGVMQGMGFIVSTHWQVSIRSCKVPSQLLGGNPWQCEWMFSM